MSNPNQPQQNQQPQSQKTVTIRMKPNCGRMMVGRKWQLSDGTIADTQPKDPQERLNPVDVWLEERTQDSEGTWSEGPTADVPESIIKPMLDASGKPKRVIEGYRMQFYPGQQDTDINGVVRQLRGDFSPAVNLGATDDATFEIVRKVS